MVLWALQAMLEEERRKNASVRSELKEVRKMNAEAIASSPKTRVKAPSAEQGTAGERLKTPSEPWSLVLDVEPTQQLRTAAVSTTLQSILRLVLCQQTAGSSAPHADIFFPSQARASSPLQRW